MSQKPDVEIRNKLLNALSEECKQLLTLVEPVSLEFKAILHEADQPIEHVYFPNSGMVSVTTHLEAGPTLEIITIGNEGIVGLPALMGTQTLPFKTFVQIPGEGWRVEAEALKAEIAGSEPLNQLLQNYMQTLFVHAGQSSACNRLHSMRERCARWLLTTADRIGSDEFNLTQEFLAEMLGARRAAVNEVCHELQHQNLIRYSRGHIRILNHSGLELVACECYGLIKAEYERLLN